MKIAPRLLIYYLLVSVSQNYENAAPAGLDAFDAANTQGCALGFHTMPFQGVLSLPILR